MKAECTCLKWPHPKAYHVRKPPSHLWDVTPCPLTMGRLQHVRSRLHALQRAAVTAKTLSSLTYLALQQYKTNIRRPLTRLLQIFIHIHASPSPSVSQPLCACSSKQALTAEAGPELAIWNGHDTNCRDAEQIEGSASNDGGWTSHRQCPRWVPGWTR